MYKLTAILLLALSLALPAAARAKEPIRIGALYSVTGTMAISETSLKPVYIGQIRPDGQYDVIWQSNGSVTGDPWFDPVSAQSEEERQ